MTVIRLIGKCNNCIKAGKECCTASRITVLDGECQNWKDADDYYRELAQNNKGVDFAKCRK